MDRRGFIHTIATLEGKIYIRSRNSHTTRLPNELIEEYLEKLEATGQRGRDFADRYRASVVEVEEGAENEFLLPGISLSEPWEPILPIQAKDENGRLYSIPWNKNPLCLVISNWTETMTILDNKEFQIESNDRGHIWEIIE